MSRNRIISSTDIELGSGNVFEDLGHPDSEEKLVKADLSIAIARAIRDRRISQAAAAAILGCTQPEVSNIMRGQLRGFTIERLMSYLTALGQNVEITITPAGKSRGHLLVQA